MRPPSERPHAGDAHAEQRQDSRFRITIATTTMRVLLSSSRRSRRLTAADPRRIIASAGRRVMSEFRTQLENPVSARHSRMNPFTELWVNGELTRQQLAPRL